MATMILALAVIGGLALEDHTVDDCNEVLLLFLHDDRRCRRRHGDRACRSRGGRHRRCRGRRPSMLVLVLVIAVMVTRGRVHAGAAMIASASAAVIAIISSLRDALLRRSHVDDNRL